MGFVPDVTVVGGGLAGCEAAFQLARRGVRVSLVEMKPARMSPAHSTPLLAELVCSNSLRSDDPLTPAALLKAELRRAGSLLIECAESTRVPAGAALAVDRHAFSRLVTTRIALRPEIRLERRTLEALPPEGHPVIIAGGPLVGGGLAREIARLAGDRFYFYDAIAPIVDGESIDWSRAFRGSRYGRNTEAAGGAAEGDYVNCPLTEAEYHLFVDELRRGRKVLPRAFEEPRWFEGCLPIEVMAERGPDVLAFGPMRPVGLSDLSGLSHPADPADPADGRRAETAPPYAVLQLRAEDRHALSYNLVGCQTRLTWPEQKRIFSLIPALRRAEFLRYGSIHRNSYLESPRLLDGELRLRARPDLRFAGQITGVEGYIESIAIGLLVALFVTARLRGRPVEPPPAETAIGGLHRHLTRPRQPGESFQPSNVNFGLLPPLEQQTRRSERRGRQVERALHAIEPWLRWVAAA